MNLALFDYIRGRLTGGCASCMPHVHRVEGSFPNNQMTIIWEVDAGTHAHDVTEICRCCLCPRQSWCPCTRPSAPGYRSTFRAAWHPRPPRRTQAHRTLRRPSQKPVMPCGETHATTLTIASDVGGPEDGEGGAHAEAVVPPAPPPLPVQFWPPGFLAYKMVQDRDQAHSGDDDKRRAAASSSEFSIATIPAHRRPHHPRRRLQLCICSPPHPRCHRHS